MSDHLKVLSEMLGVPTLALEQIIDAQKHERMLCEYFSVSDLSELNKLTKTHKQAAAIGWLESQTTPKIISRIFPVETLSNDDKKSHQKTPSDTGKDGAKIRTIKRLNDININNKHKKKFNSLLEVYEFFLKEYERKSKESPILKEPHIYDEIAREFGMGGGTNLLFKGTSIKTQVSKIRPKK